MTDHDFKSLLERVQSWPESAQDELTAVANEIETELKAGEYIASADELQAIDEAIASLDAGEFASDAEIAAVRAKFRRD
jgi:hypothetical protein